MGKVHVLSEDLANQIAAGEVVERPASVVKELVENALDAGSTKIKITLEEGGLSLIRVRDNGNGMTRDDVEHAFMRHATSKIASKKDLFSIRSLGFRGEALPSIAAVSLLECRTVSSEEDIGTSVVWKGGKKESTEAIAHPEGTDIYVRQLFYNTPARLKYLKTVNTEISHVTDVVNRLALAYPGVSFELKHEGRTLLHTLGDGRLIHVIQAIYGQTVARAMLPVQAEHVDFTLNGFIGKPEITRATRHYMTLLINRRYIRSYPLTQAVLEAYNTLLPINRMPVAVLCLKMDPQLVDVNVHPAKMEVRFSKEKELREWLTAIIRERLMKESLIPQIRLKTNQANLREEQEKMNLPPRDEIRETTLEYSGGALVKHDSESLTADKVSQHWVEADHHTSNSEDNNTPVTPVDKSSTTARLQPHPVSDTPEEHVTKGERIPDLTPLAQVHGTYIVAQSEASLFLIDQHAAHERVYYEHFRRKLDGVNIDQQELLFPINIELTAAESEVLKEKLSLLNDVGIELEPFGPQSYIVRSHPTWFPNGHEEALIREMIDWVLHHNRLSLAELREESAKQMACKAAIKANRHLRRDEMQSLLYRLQESSNPFTCPHGRPILVEFSAYEMEKMFKRVM